jgi:putative PIN family toxin of toxin-antitoxin system
VRVFLDTNVLVSAFASRGLCADLFETVLLEHDLLIGRNVLRELGRALRRKVKLPAAVADDILEFVSGEAAAVVTEPATVDAKVDSEDALVLGEALAGAEDVFVTGDLALVRLNSLRKLRIASPRDFWEILHSEA